LAFIDTFNRSLTSLFLDHVYHLIFFYGRDSGFFALSSATISAAASRACIRLVGRKADGAHAGMTAAAVALADSARFVIFAGSALVQGLEPTETLVRKLELDRPME
jgi:hypothetical protein